jgi:hypothetical protein
MECFNVIAHLDIVEVIDIKTTFVAVFHFSDIFFETFQRSQCSGIDNDTFTDNPYPAVAVEFSIADDTSGTVPTLVILKDSSTSAVPRISSLISGDSIPCIAAFISLIAS